MGELPNYDFPDLQLVLLFCAASRANYFRVRGGFRGLNTTIPCEGASADFWVA